MHSKRFVTLLVLCVVAAGGLPPVALAAGPDAVTDSTVRTSASTADRTPGETVRLGSRSLDVRDLVVNVSDVRLNGTGLPAQEIDRAHYTVQNARFATDGFTVRYGGTTYNVGAITVSVDDVGIVLRNVVIADGASRGSDSDSASTDGPSTAGDSSQTASTDGDGDDGDAGDDDAGEGSERTSSGEGDASAGAEAGDEDGDADAFLDVAVACGADGAELTVTNVGSTPVEVRDLDVTGRSQDVVTGRPVLPPGESTTLAPVSDGRVELQAFAPGSVGDAVGPVHVRNVDCTPS